MRKLVVSQWTTLDGVFDADSMEAWFAPYHSEERGRYIREGLHAAGALLLGRVTYDLMARYWPNQRNDEAGLADRLNGMPKYVVSRSLADADWNNSTIVAGDVEAAVAALKAQPGEHLLTFGSAALVRTLLEAKLVDELRLLVHPVVVGRGKRAFGEGVPVTGLELVGTRALPSGVLALSYRPAGATR